MIFSNKFSVMPIDQLINVLAILKEKIKDEKDQFPYIVLAFDKIVNAAIRIDYDRRTKNVSITCTNEYLEMTRLLELSQLPAATL